MSDAAWVPPGIDQETPSAARLYDYFLGGDYNFAVDRQLGERIAAVLPQARHMARVNRAFLRRAVSHCALAGIRQFIDLGCGLPSMGPVHEVAQRVDPECRIVYVDNEPVVTAHGELLLAGNERAAIIRADLRDHEAIFEHERTRALIDFDLPVAVLTVAVLHFLPDDGEAADVIARYAGAVAPGSFLVFSHITNDVVDHETARKSVELYNTSQNKIYPRPRAAIAAMLGDCPLIDPGLVFVPAWRPDSPADAENPDLSSFYGAVARLG